MSDETPVNEDPGMTIEPADQPQPAEPTSASIEDELSGPVGPDALDLTPRVTAPAVASRGNRRILPKVIAAAAILSLAGVAFFGLRSATVYFKYVDEAVAQKDELGDSFFRMQGNIVEDSVKQTDDGAAFTLRRKGVSVVVEHHGAEPALFGDPRIPVVVEGHFSGDQFVSQRILVNHDASYEEENGDRLTKAKTEAEEELKATTP